jgi:hypothetical protein
MLKNILIIFSAIFVIVGYSYAGSIKEYYELQERCGKSSADFFKKMYGTGYDIKDMVHSYTSHYNKKLNKCFIEIVSIVNDESGQQVSLMMELYDVHENELYAIFYKSSEKMNCSLYIPQPMKCNSQERWNYLVKPFMRN